MIPRTTRPHLTQGKGQHNGRQAPTWTAVSLSIETNEKTLAAWHCPGPAMKQTDPRQSLELTPPSPVKVRFAFHLDGMAAALESGHHAPGTSKVRCSSKASQAHKRS